MSAGGQFEIGPDTRRHKGGRPPGAVGLAQLVRRKLAPAAPEVLDRLVIAAKSGDTEAVNAFAVLLAGIAHRQPESP